MKRILINLKTSLFGAVAGVPQIADGIATKDATKIIVGLATLCIGLFAKDSDVH